jgi:hypothetical protein
MGAKSGDESVDVCNKGRQGTTLCHSVSSESHHIQNADPQYIERTLDAPLQKQYSAVSRNEGMKEPCRPRTNANADLSKVEIQEPLRSQPPKNQHNGDPDLSTKSPATDRSC